MLKRLKNIQTEREMDSGNDWDSQLQMLTSRLKQTQDKVNYWSKEEIPRLLSNQKLRRETALKEINEQIEKYTALVSNEQKENDIVDKQLGEKCEQLEKLKKELEQLCEVSHELHTKKAKDESEIDAVKQDIDKLKNDIAAPTEAKKKLEYLNKASECFGSRLGLKFKKTKGNKIQVIFTQIDEKDPLMVFYFFLQIEGLGRKYVVSYTEPKIAVDDLVTELNQSNNLRKFMISMRNRFKDTLSDK